MADYGATENLALLRRTVAGTFDFKGRSRRTEVLYFWIATSLANIVVGFSASAILHWKAVIVFNIVFGILIVAPEFALFARRLHDQNRSGWWAIILPIIIGLNISRSFNFIINTTHDELPIESPSSSIELWIGVPLVIAFLVFCFIPGTNGDNRFGPDPRID